MRHRIVTVLAWSMIGIAGCEAALQTQPQPAPPPVGSGAAEARRERLPGGARTASRSSPAPSSTTTSKTWWASTWNAARPPTPTFSRSSGRSPGSCAEVDGAEINDQALPHVAKLKDLTDLSLMNTDIHDDAVKELQALPKLKSLGLRRAVPDRCGPGHLKACPNRQVLAILYNNFDDDGMAQIKEIKKLRAGHRGCVQIGDEGLEQTQGHAEPHLAQDGRSPNLGDAGMNRLKGEETPDPRRAGRRHQR